MLRTAQSFLSGRNIIGFNGEVQKTHMSVHAILVLTTEAHGHCPLYPASKNRPSGETPFKWRFACGPILARLLSKASF